MAILDIKVPDIGDFAEVTVIELMVKPGDTVKPDQSLITVESDKASMEIPCSHGGVVKELKVKLGDKVKEGSVVLVLEGEGAEASPSPSSGPAKALPVIASPSTGSGQAKAWQSRVSAAQGFCAFASDFLGAWLRWYFPPPLWIAPCKNLC